MSKIPKQTGNPNSLIIKAYIHYLHGSQRLSGTVSSNISVYEGVCVCNKQKQTYSGVRVYEGKSSGSYKCKCAVFAKSTLAALEQHYSAQISYISTALITVLSSPTKETKPYSSLKSNYGATSSLLGIIVLAVQSSFRVLTGNPNFGVQWTSSFDGRAEEEMQMKSPSSSHDQTDDLVAE